MKAEQHEGDRDTQVVNLQQKFDYVLVGGGLQTGLIVLALRHYRPSASVLIVERSETLAGNHTWSFHTTDIAPHDAAWLRPIIEHQWDDYDVNVGGRIRHVNIGYCTVSSQHFARQLHAWSAGSDGSCSILLNSTVESVAADRVVLSDGREIAAHCVIDNRGPRDSDSGDSDSGDSVPTKFAGGYQSFWGFELQLPSDWPLSRPVIMDDRVDQTDGFRFIYSLPFEPRRVLVEDTRFSNTPSLARSECFHTVDGYLRRITAGKLGIEHCEIVREESGVLPMPYQGFYPTSGQDTLTGGYRGGWFHAATGYSFPMALRFANWVATMPVERLPSRISLAAQGERGRAVFARLLNRLLFELVRPQSRYQIFRRFYRVLSEQRIARFYAHRFTALDAARIVIGTPPGGLQPIRFARSFWTRSSNTDSRSTDRPESACAVSLSNFDDTAHTHRHAHPEEAKP